MTCVGSNSCAVGNINIELSDSIVVFVDCQIELFPFVRDYHPVVTRNNILGVANLCKAFNLPHIITTSSPIANVGKVVIPELKKIFPASLVTHRNEINPWDNQFLNSSIKSYSKKNIILCGLTLDTAILFLALSILQDKNMSSNVCIVTDACGCSDTFVRESAILRLQTCGADLLSWYALALRFQKNCKDEDKLKEVLKEYLPHLPMCYPTDKTMKAEAQDDSVKKSENLIKQ